VPRTRRLLPLAAALVALVALALAGVAPASAAAPTATPGALVLRVLAPTPAQVQWLSANTDLLEARVGADYFVLGEASVVSRLRAKGLQVRIDGRMAPLPRSGGPPGTRSRPPSTRRSSAGTTPSRPSCST
jgi:hypothetical protein